ncbi:MAG: alpha/beta hydrolase [Acidimicrobiales bacterium]
MLSALAGGRMLGSRFGSEPPGVVALHGWARSGADFDRVLTGLDAVAPDLPGFGATAPPDAAWGSAEYASAVLPLCEEGPPPIVVGHSFGGRVAVMLAAAHPERVGGLVLTGTPLWRPEGSVAPSAGLGFRLVKRLHAVGLIGDDWMEKRRQRSGSQDYKAAAGVMRAVLVRAIAETNDGTYRRALAAVTCPIALVWGERDTAAPLAVAREAHAATGAALTVLPGVGHMTPVDAPDALHAAISSLLGDR